MPQEEGMNGIISKIASRSISTHRLTPRQIGASLATGLCLFSGFALGNSVQLPPLNTFGFQTVSFSKIAWLKDDLQDKKITIAPATESITVTRASAEEVFVPFVLEPRKTPATCTKAKVAKGKSNLEKLRALYTRLNSPIENKNHVNVFEDFRTAASNIRTDFKISAEFPKPAAVATIVKLRREPAEAKPQVTHAVIAVKPHPVSRVVHATPAPKKVLSPVAVMPVIAAKPVQDAGNESEPAKTALVQTEQVTQTFSSATGELPDVHFNDVLTQEEKSELANELLAVQVNHQQEIKSPMLEKAPSAAKIEHQNLKSQETQAPSTSSTTASEQYAQKQLQNRKNSDGCNILDSQEFAVPTNTALVPLNTQICPDKKEWLSKGWSDRGWVKLEGPQNYPTVMYYPAPNEGATLLLNQNSLNLLALRSGIHMAEGAGTIVGTVPAGYKIEFTGRGEETQYFETGSKKYFVIFNGEPGAGVIELLSEENQKLSTTVFTPVFENAITYLDIGTPKTVDVPVQIVKNGTENDPEVVGLSVGFSTQTGIQAITQSHGKAVLKNVNIVPGFPVYLDVASKTNQEQSFTYRYELPQKDLNSAFVLNQIQEKSLKHWLQQVKLGLSEQSAMIVGFYDRKILDGFKNQYTVKTEAKSSKLGLDAQNFSILWDGQISSTEPLEGDLPRFMSVQVPEGITQVNLIKNANQVVHSSLIPISPRVIHVVSD